MLCRERACRLVGRCPLSGCSYRSSRNRSRRPKRFHAALAVIIEDHERRLWYCAAATIGPDDELAAKYHLMATRAERRGAIADANVMIGPTGLCARLFRLSSFVSGAARPCRRCQREKPV